MDKKAFEQHLDASWQTFRQQLVDVYSASLLESPLLQPNVLQEVSASEVPDLEEHSEKVVEEEKKEQDQTLESEHEEFLGSQHPLLRNGLTNLGKREAESVKNRLRLRLGQLISGSCLLDAVAALGLTRYTEEEMNDFVNLLGEFISLQFVETRRSQSSVNSLNSWFRLQGDSVNKDFSMGKPVWHWPLEESPRHSPRHDSNKDWLRKRAPKYNCVPAMPLLEILMSQETEVHKLIFGPMLNQYKAIREILVAGDTNRLVAELTFVRINDLAAPPEPMHPIMYLEPFVAIVILANGIVTGFQTDPLYRDWPGWIYVELAFAFFLLSEIFLRMYVLGWSGYWHGSEQKWNWFDIFLLAISTIDIVVHLAGSPTDISSASLLRLCRLIRLVRIVKVFRVKMMRDLRLMVKGLLAGVRTLLLAFVLLFAVLYVIAGFATMTIGSAERTVEMGFHGYFDNIPTSMFTAFRCFTGECINDDGRPLQTMLATEYGFIFVFFYVASYMLVTMGIFNVILAVYVDITMKAAKESDAQGADQNKRESIRVARTTRELIKIFSAAYNAFRDQSSADEEQPIKPISASEFMEDGMTDQVHITKELFLLVIQDRHVQKLMDDLDLPPDRANLFEMLDGDGSGTLQTAELLQGLLKVRGEVNKSDTVANLLATKAVQNLVSDYQDQNAHAFQSLSQGIALLRAEVGTMRKAESEGNRQHSETCFSPHPRQIPLGD
ncbi:Cacna1a [Symbiodinium pilosum]|uniref:Cacna1a protein n=1 Tax=Symbiodinium pilosum TaxID=2952 RepID=A0A812XLB5_SYMPI|nr:Cacna1a [Symbiodinium pilosum]